MKPGEKLIDKESNTVYVIRCIHREEIILVSEDGEAIMLLQQESVVSAGLEPIYD